MKQIRQKIFETNSSSTHSLSIYRKNEAEYSILEDTIITKDEFLKVSVRGGGTELEKLRLCTNLMFLIINRDSKEEEEVKKSVDITKSLINGILLNVRNSKLGDDIGIDELSNCSDVFYIKQPILVLGEFIKNSLGKGIVGEDIFSPSDNLVAVIQGIEEIIFSPDVVVLDEELFF